MIQIEHFEQFTVYKSDISRSFLYADFNNPTMFMNGLAEYLLSENSLLNYANTLTPIEFKPTPAMYKKLYTTLGSFLNSDLELLEVDDESDEIYTALGEEYHFVDVNGKVHIQKDKIGKIGEYAMHLLLTSYYKIHCIIPKFRCTTDRNMSVFGIDSLFFDPQQKTIYFGESKVCKNIENAIRLVNRSFEDYERQIAEEYKLVLANEEVFNLSQEFKDAFGQYTEICISFQDFIKAASVNKICVPAFLAHGNSDSINAPEQFLQNMNEKLRRNQFFGIETDYIFISLPIIDKAEMMNILMRKIVKKSGEYQNGIHAV